MAVYSIGIVGESFANDDGSSRQEEIRRCCPGEAVTLERDPGNVHDAKCVKVLSARRVQIGNISRDHPWICERLDRGAFIDARIWKIAKGAKGMCGVVLTVRTAEGDEWDDPAEDEEEEAVGAELSCGQQVGCVAATFIALLVVVGLLFG